MDTIKEKWNEILERVKEEHELGEVSFKTWLKPLTVHKVQDHTVTILVPSERVGLEYVSKKYKLPLKVAIAEITGEDCDIEFILPEDIERMELSEKASSASSVAGLNPKYTFSTFVVGSNNKFAHAASLAVAESPGEIYNPLFLYGGVGLGKTHLMHSIAHFIIGKESTQEEFFHTFNSLHSARKQIILSSDRPPKDMDILEERIRSRFEWGLMADIQSPDYETRMAILRKKQELEGYDVGNDVIEYIAQNVKSNIRELEGSMNKVIALADLEKREINLALAEQALADIISPNEKRVVTPEYIINVVAEHFDITPEDIKSDKRSSKIAFPRQICMYLCNEMTSYKLKAIGQIMGGKDHTTIMYGCKKIEGEIAKSESTRNTIELLKKKINPSL